MDKPVKGQNPLYQLPHSKSITSWRLQHSKSTTSPQHKQQIRNKLAWAKVRCDDRTQLLCRVIPKFHYKDLLPTCCGLVGHVANKSATSWQLPHLWGSYGETCVMDFGHNAYMRQVLRLCPMHTVCNELDFVEGKLDNSSSAAKIVLSWIQTLCFSN